MINGCQHVVGTEISFKIGDRREGDPARLVADNRLALSSLNWCPKYNNIYEIIKSNNCYICQAKFLKIRTIKVQLPYALPYVFWVALG